MLKEAPQASRTNLYATGGFLTAPILSQNGRIYAQIVSPPKHPVVTVDALCSGRGDSAPMGAPDCTNPCRY